MLGVIVNTLAIMIGSIIGLIFKKGIPERFSEAALIGLGLCTAYVGIDGMLSGDNVLVCIASMVIGAIIGTALDIDGKLNMLGDKVSEKFNKTDGKTSIAQGFVTGTLMCCVGAMGIVGSLNAGLTANYEVLFAKSLIDFIAGIMLTVSLGFGVFLSAFCILIYQGSIVLLAGVIAPFLSDGIIAEMTCVGSILIFALSLNIVGIAKFKIADYAPAIFVTPFVYMVFSTFM